MRPDDPRVGDLLGRKLRAGRPPRAVLIGFPTDEGVRRNGGRRGAAAAPAEIRRAFLRLTPDARAGAAMVELLEETADLGDLRVSRDLERDQERLADAIAPHLAAGTFVLVIGGGHETAYGHFLGHVRAGRDMEILNWDAHPDVRPLLGTRGHSGSPFRQALLHPSGRCRRYRVAGLLPHSTASAHLAFIAARAGGHLWRDDLDPKRIAALYRELRRPAMVSFDIDAVDASQAPGVSAPAAGGMSAALWLAAAEEAGRCPRVASCDLVEMNPAFDRDGQTARLGGLTLWSVLSGVARRGRPPRRGRV